MAKKTKEFKGLDAFFSDNTFVEESAGSERVTVDIGLIDTNAEQPRKSFDTDALAGLADSISANGLLQPILVRKLGERYEIIAGERRFRASRLAGLNEIPVIVVDADDLSAAKFALIENLQREDLNPYEEAAAYRRLMDEYDLSQEDISRQIGKSRSAIANSLRLLDLPDEVVRLLINGTITAGHGRALLGLRDRDQMLPLAERCVSRNLSVRDMEAAVKAANRAYAASLEEESAEETPLKIDYLSNLAARFTNMTGRRCKISDNRSHKTFTIEFRDNEDLEELLKTLAGNGIFEDL